KQNDHILGKFEYNKLPIELGPFKGDCTTEYYFSVYDCLNERCAAKASLGKVCCEQSGGDCEISNLKYEKTPCNDHQEFYIYFNFLHKNTSECFSVKGNGIDYGKFKYADLPIKIGPLKGNCETEYEFVFTDCINEKCHLVKEVGKVCCETHSEDCRLSELKIEKTKCEADKTFFAILNFDHKNNSDCFIVSGNGIQYGRFLYSQLPVKIGPLKANCETEYEFVVRDCENEKCVSKGLLGKVCCEDSKLCELSNLELGRTECNAEGFFSIKLNFKYKNVSECFVVRQNNNVLGKFKYSQLPLTLGKFKGDCTTNYLFTITDCLSERCGIRKELGRVCCKPISSTCSLTDLKFEKTSCNENKEVYLVINFNSKNTSDCFTVNGNGHNYGTFQYKDLPVKIGPLKANCETKYELVIRDSKNERCVLEKEIGVLCCDRLSGACEISNLIVKPLECTGKSMYAISLNFNHTGTKGIGFDLFDASGKNIGFYSYRTLPLTIKEFKASGNDTDYLKVCENDNEKCCAEVKFDALKCLTAFPGNFSLDLVEIRYANDHLIIWSPNPFPEKFYYYVSDASGKDQLLHEVFRDKNQIGLNTGTLLNGIYLIKLQDQFRIQNLKYIK
ncbi:MAG: hypothetical protein IT267_03060, partial [Saprospiraceae bacterium]|nr:hypothetical protein [Saprospiraceae bacterium]